MLEKEQEETTLIIERQEKTIRTQAKMLEAARQERDCALSDTSVKHKYRADVLESQLEAARAEVEEHRKELDSVEANLLAADRRTVDLQSQLEQARQSNEAMREALRFYAKANHYQSCICGGHLPSLDYPCPMCNGELTAIEEDNGIRARQALDAGEKSDVDGGSGE